MLRTWQRAMPLQLFESFAQNFKLGICIMEVKSANGKVYHFMFPVISKLCTWEAKVKS